MELGLIIAAIFVYMLGIHYVEKLALKNKALKFIGGLILISTLPIMMAYFYNNEELVKYECALRGEHFIDKPTDAEYDAMLQELDEQDIKRNEKILQLRKTGKNKDDAEYEAFENEESKADFAYIANKYPGHNPPKEIIEQKIVEMKESRTKRIFVVFVGIFIIYYFIWNKKFR